MVVGERPPTRPDLLESLPDAWAWSVRVLLGLALAAWGATNLFLAVVPSAFHARGGAESSTPWISIAIAVVMPPSLVLLAVSKRFRPLGVMILVPAALHVVVQFMLFGD